MKTLDKERKKRLTKDVRFTEDSWSRFINVFPFFFPFLVEEENLELSLKTTCCLSDRRKQLKQHTQTLREKKERGCKDVFDGYVPGSEVKYTSSTGNF